MNAKQLIEIVSLGSFRNHGTFFLWLFRPVPTVFSVISLQSEEQSQFHAKRCRQLTDGVDNGTKCGQKGPIGKGEIGPLTRLNN